ncbi:MAG: FIG017108: hypothetical protein, partial [uncultured Frankineae bacterium]
GAAAARRPAAARRAEAPPALHQARSAALHEPPRHRAGVRAGAASGAGADGLLRGLLPAPEDQLGRRCAHRGGQRGGVRRDLRGGAGRSGAAAGGAGREPAHGDRRRGRRRGAARHEPAGPGRGLVVGHPPSSGAARRARTGRRGVPRHRHAGGAAADEGRQARPRRPCSRDQHDRVGGRRRGALCDTEGGRTARDACCPTRRRPLRTPVRGRPRTAGASRGNPVRAGAAH